MEEIVQKNSQLLSPEKEMSIMVSALKHVISGGDGGEQQISPDDGSRQILEIRMPVVVVVAAMETE